MGSRKTQAKRPNAARKAADLRAQAHQAHAKGDLDSAISLYEQLITNGHADAGALSNLAVIYKSKGQHAIALELYNKAIQSDAKSVQAWNNLSNLLRTMGRHHAAVKAAIKCLEIDSTYAEGYNNLASAYIELGDYRLAQKAAKRCTEINPSHYDAWLSLSLAYVKLSRSQLALDAAATALRLKPGSEDAISNYIEFLKHTDCHNSAIYLAELLLSAKPDDATAYTRLSGIYSSIGKIDQSQKHALMALEHDPFNDAAHSILARQGFYKKESEASEANVGYLFSAECLEAHQGRINEQVNILFARAEAYHHRKQYTLAAESLSEANRLKRQHYGSDLAVHLKSLSETDQLFQSAQTVSLDSGEEFHHLDGITPLFIVGLPRSGSTLLETILSCTKTCKDLGETTLFSECFSQVREACLPLEMAGCLYLDKVAQLSFDALSSTDKMLYNSAYTGLILKAIPHARIIHCRRNPLDNILSIHRTNFGSGNHYSTSVAEAAIYWKAVVDHMAKYEALHKDRIYTFDYDQVVSNPDQEIKRLIAWLGWAWDDAYLAPHKNMRSVHTASIYQVRSPINNKSVGGWKNYSAMLEPARQKLVELGAIHDGA